MRILFCLFQTNLSTVEIDEGVVISFVEITEIVKIREALRKANELQRLAAVVRDAD